MVYFIGLHAYPKRLGRNFYPIRRAYQGLEAVVELPIFYPLVFHVLFHRTIGCQLHLLLTKVMVCVVYQPSECAWCYVYVVMCIWCAT